MRGGSWRRWTQGVLAAMALLASPGATEAATPAGTVIENTATATYRDAEAATHAATSPTVGIPVAVTPGVRLFPEHQRAVAPGERVVLSHRLENTGNVPLTLGLTLTGGTWASTLLLDENGNGVPNPPEQFFGQTVHLAPGQALLLLTVTQVPDGAAEGSADTFSLTATAADPGLSVTVNDRLIVQSNGVARIDLVAEPKVILGDGKDRSRLTATVRTASGAIVPDGIPVTFTTPRGTFENGARTITLYTRDGVAATDLISELIADKAVEVIAQVVAGTPVTGIATTEVVIVITPMAITGVITDRRSGLPVPQVPILLVDEAGEPVGEIVTAADGSYRLTVSVAGLYTILVPVVNSVGDTVHIRQSVRVDQVGGISLSPQGAIVGVVVDAVTGEPLSHIVLDVSLEQVLTSRARGSRAPLVVRLTTDARGGYVIDGLNLGEYRMEVTSADGRHYAHGEVSAAVTRPGEYVINADIALDPFGYVYNRVTGEPIAGASVWLTDVRTGAPVVTRQGRNPDVTRADGTYTFLVDNGLFHLRASAPGYAPWPGEPVSVTRNVINRTIPLDPLPALSVVKTVDRAEAQPGEEVAYTITVTNSGLGDATGVVVGDTLPEFLSLVPESLAPGASYDTTTRRLTWPVGLLPRAGAPVTLLFRARVAAVMPQGATEVANTATVACSELPEPVASAAAVTRVAAAPRLEIIKTADRQSVASGETVRFTLTFRNTGNAVARGVTVTDQLPQGMTAMECAISWSLDALEPGREEVRVVTARVDGNGLKPGLRTLTNTAVIAAEGIEPVSATAEVMVLLPYLRVTKQAARSQAQTGDVVPFEIVVENLSEDETATDLRIRDVMPAGLAYQRGTARRDGAVPDEPEIAGAEHTWRLSRLGPGMATRITFHAIVTGSGETVMTNTAVATAMATGGQTMTVGPARASVRRRESFFAERGMIIGRVFVDVDGNGRPDDGEPGIGSVAVFTETGVMAITDPEGKYVLPDVGEGEHVIRIDTTTLPAGYMLQPHEIASARNPLSRFCRLQAGGIAKANFSAVGSGPTVGSARPGTPRLRPVEPFRR